MIEHDLVENDTIAGRLDIYMVTTHVKIFVDGRDNLSSNKIFLAWVYVYGLPITKIHTYLYLVGNIRMVAIRMA